MKNLLILFNLVNNQAKDNTLNELDNRRVVNKIKMEQLQQVVGAPASKGGREDQVVAAEAVNDGNALDTPIEGHEAVKAVVKIKTSATVTEINRSSREMVWKTSEGIEKRLILPIEMIKEEVMDDPEHFISTFKQGEMPEDEYLKMKEAINDMRDSMRQYSSQQRNDTTSTGPGIGTLIDAAHKQNDYETLTATVTEQPPVHDVMLQVPQSLQQPAKVTAYKLAASKKSVPKRGVRKSTKNVVVRKGSRHRSGDVQQQLNAHSTGKVADVGDSQKTLQLESVQGELPHEELYAPIEDDPTKLFERLKAQFYDPSTQMNTPEQLLQLMTEQAEEEKHRKEAAELKKQQEEEEQSLQRDHGVTPSIAAITKLLQQEERTRRALRKKQRDLRIDQLIAEKLEAGEELDEQEIKKIREEELEDIDYTIAMAEEENVPEAQKDNIERELDMQGKKMRQVIRQQGKLVKLMPESLLPKKLPDNLVYWNKCETRIESQKLVTYSKIQNFQKATIIQFENKIASDRVMKVFPIIDDLEMWADPSQQKYVNNHEQAIYNMRKFPPSMKEYAMEGLIKLSLMRPYECLFNSRFESGNLRQVFKVPKEVDFDTVPIDDEIPDYLPEELQELQAQENKKNRLARLKDRQKKHLEEEKEDVEDMKLTAKERKKTYSGAFEPYQEEPPSEDEKVLNVDLEELNHSDGGADTDDDGKKKRRGNKKQKKQQRDLVKPACEYNLYLQDDTYADSALFQWYYFSVMNIRQDTVIRINICNLSKPNGLYNKGMKPFVYSMNKQKQTGSGWHRGGENISYSSNGHVARYSKKTLDAHWMSDGTPPVGKDNYKQLHSLSFDYRFESDYDIVFFAHFQPYTYTDLVNFLCTLKNEESYQDKMRMDHICNALGGAPLYGLTITNDIGTKYINQGKEIFKYRNYEYKKAQVKPKKVKYLDKPKATGMLVVDNSDNETPSISVVTSSHQDPVSPMNKRTDAQTEAKTEEKDTESAKLLAKRPKMIQVKPLNIEDDALTESLSQQKELSTPAVVDSRNTDAEEDNSRSSPLRSNDDQLVTPTKKRKSKGLSTQIALNQALFETHYSGKRNQGIIFPQAADPNEGKEEKTYKKYLFLTSRVHPGESQASHIVHGMIKWLLSDDPEADEIREKFIVKVIPMLNPDGVIHGNYRVSLLGVDLNRRWRKPSKFMHPTVYYAKQIIKYCNEKGRQPGCDSGGVVLSCDIHGHSRNMDLFTYNCADDASMQNLNIRAVAFGIDKRCPIFNLNNCKFANEKDKENTARIVLYKEAGILSSFTLECTYFGSEFLRRQKQGHFLLTKDQQEYQADRYGIAHARKDIQIDAQMCKNMGADVLKGVNYASKKRPLLQYWFRNPPKNQIELWGPGGNQKDNEIDPALLELEKAWKPIGNIQQDKHLGIGDRFDERNDGNTNRPPSLEKKGRRIDLLDVALLDKLKKMKKKKKKQQPQKDSLNILIEKDGAVQGHKDYSNTDMVDVMSPDKLTSNKKRKRRQGGFNKRKPSQLKHHVHQNQRSQITLKSGRGRSNSGDVQTRARRSAVGNSNDSSGEENVSSVGRKVPILLREPGGNNAMYDSESESNESRTSELRASQHVYSGAPGFDIQLNKMNLTQTAMEGRNHMSKFGEQLHDKPAPLNRDSSSDSDHDDEIYLKSKELDSQGRSHSRKRHSLGLVSSETPSIKHPHYQNQKHASQSVTRMPASISSGSKRQLSVRMRDGKYSFAGDDISRGRLLPRIESQLETNSAEDGDNIESRLMTSGRPTMQDIYHTPRGKGQKEQATSYLKELADSQLRQDFFNEFEHTKNQQVSADELDGENFSRAEQYHLGEAGMSKRVGIDGGIVFGVDERMKKQEAPSRSSSLARDVLIGLAGANFHKNKLSVDPVVLPTSKLEKISKIQMKTMEREASTQFISLKSPRRTKQSAKKKKSPGKFVFAPQNGVYNQTQLLQNPDLAKQENINFMVTAQGQDSFLGPSISALMASPLQMHMTSTFQRQPLSLKTRTEKKFKSGRSRNFKATTIYSPAGSQFKTSPKAFRATQQLPKKVDQSVQQATTTNFSTSTRQKDLTSNTDDNAMGQLPSQRSVQSLLKRSGDGTSPLKHQPSQATIQTALGPAGEQGLSMSEYVNQNLSLLESTKVKVAAKRKKRMQVYTEILSGQGDGSQGLKGATYLEDLNATLVLPKILKQESEGGRVVMIKNRKDTMALVDSHNDDSSMMDLGSIQQPQAMIADVSLHAKPSTTELRVIQTTSDSLGSGERQLFDGQMFELPALLGGTIKQPQKRETMSSIVSPSPMFDSTHMQTKRYLQVKNGFDFANNMNDRQMEKLLDVKLTNTLRDRERRKNRPQFVIKPLDQRDFLKIQLQHVENQFKSTPVSPDRHNKKRKQKKHSAAIAELRQSLDSESQPENKIKVLDGGKQQSLKSTNFMNTLDQRGGPGSVMNETTTTTSALSPKMSPRIQEKRSVSMGRTAWRSFASPSHCFTEKKQSHPALLMHGQTALPQLTAAKASHVNAIRDREGKSVAVHRLVNQTVVSGNKLLVFKGI